MKVLITGGANGQLKNELLQSAPNNVELLAPNDRLDLRDHPLVSEAIRSMRPDIVINAAAYTAVDGAESEKELAFEVNDAGVGHLCQCCKDIDARLMQVSTDFVFDGLSSTPYKPDDQPNPVGVYGASKYAGECQVLSHLPDSACIVRTSWVYSSMGNNFVKTMLKLMATRSELTVVADQVGSPTWAAGLAQALWKAADLKLNGVLHWTDAGVASWYDFAQAIAEYGLELGLIDNEINVKPIRTDQYPTPATRPPYSVLDKSESWELLEMEGLHWRGQLKRMLEELT